MLSHIKMLRSVGLVLAAVGVADIAFMFYCLANGWSYKSSLNIFALVAGILTYRGGLRTASFVRWSATFALAGAVTVLVAIPFLQPLDLTLTALRLYPGSFVVPGAVTLISLALLFWLQWALGHDSIQQARRDSGRPKRRMKIPVILGVVFVLAMGFMVFGFIGDRIPAHAKELAAEKLGTNYQYHVSSIRVWKAGESTDVRAIVTAWNSEEIRSVPVSWSE